MTTARLVSTPPQGSGLTSSLNDRLYRAMVKGEPTEQLIVVGIIEPVGYGQRKTARGLHQHVVLDWVALEALNSSAGDDIDRVRHMIKTAAERRHTPQQRLPLDFGDRSVRQQCQDLVALLETWAMENDFQLNEKWFDYYDEAHTAAPDGAGLQQLKEFAHAQGVIADSPIADSDEPGDGERPVEGVALPDVVPLKAPRGRKPRK